MTTELKSLYPTEVMFGSLPETVVAAVAEELLSSLDFSASSDVSDYNILGNMFNLPILKSFFKEQGVTKFNEYTEKVFNYTLDVNKCRFKAWSANGAGKYELGFHNHSGAQLSGVFYLMVENSQKFGGKIRFHDPRFNANRGMVDPFKFKHNDFEFCPKTGDFIIFPSYLYHSVSTFHGTTRLILPIDMFMDT